MNDDDLSTTSGYICNAPINAVYIWPNHNTLGKVRDLARKLDRSDITILSVGEAFSRPGALNKYDPKKIIIDFKIDRIIKQSRPSQTVTNYFNFCKKYGKWL